jgi:hypothetical protein
MFLKTACRYADFFSMENVCYRIRTQSVTEVEELSSNQEEADTNFTLHTNHALTLLFSV